MSRFLFPWVFAEHHQIVFRSQGIGSDIDPSIQEILRPYLEGMKEHWREQARKEDEEMVKRLKLYV